MVNRFHCPRGDVTVFNLYALQLGIFFIIIFLKFLRFSRHVFLMASWSRANSSGILAVQKDSLGLLDPEDRESSMLL